MDTAPILQAAASLIAAVITILSYKLWALLEERIKASAVERLGQAAERAAGTVIEAVDGARTSQSLDLVKNKAMEAATTALTSTMSETLTKLGGSRRDAERMIAGEVGKLLAKSPTAPLP
jgi:ethanolamine utilization protein EutA (predicted chaperonin)